MMVMRLSLASAHPPAGHLDEFRLELQPLPIHTDVEEDGGELRFQPGAEGGARVAFVLPVE